MSGPAKRRDDVLSKVRSDADTARSAPPSGGGAAAPLGSLRLRFKSESNDYITCRTWDGTTEGTHDVLVAKPPQLRHDYTLYAGLTGLTTTAVDEVTATNGLVIESWKVTTSYVIDGDIWATTPPSGTGVTASGNRVVWLDENRDGRVWAIK